MPLWMKCLVIFFREFWNIFGSRKLQLYNFNPVGAHLGPQRPHLSSFVTERSWLLFTLLGVNELDWLDQPPLTWINHPSYQYLRKFCKDLQVVNDPAERAVNDVQDFAQMTRDPAYRDNC